MAALQCRPRQQPSTTYGGNALGIDLLKQLHQTGNIIESTIHLVAKWILSPFVRGWQWWMLQLWSAWSWMRCIRTVIIGGGNGRYHRNYNQQGVYKLTPMIWGWKYYGVPLFLHFCRHEFGAVCFPAVCSSMLASMRLWSRHCSAGSNHIWPLISIYASVKSLKQQSTGGYEIWGLRATVVCELSSIWIWGAVRSAIERSRRGLRGEEYDST